MTIPPSNFPFPIIPPTTLPPLLPPNTLLLNPADDTVFTPYKLIQILQQPPLPQPLLNFVPRHPKQIPHYLLHHKHTHFLTFTPSPPTPTRIYQPTP
ncbi:aldehyde dehydrogenase family protein, partial [Staphylococcus epidermidis]|uniref:aldehyde dehydrogenase family protein n=1 Tax=Staphylococcus epidermidis TaxID=1282 RepID=UPI0011A191C1